MAPPPDPAFQRIVVEMGILLGLLLRWSDADVPQRAAIEPLIDKRRKRVWAMIADLPQAGPFVLSAEVEAFAAQLPPAYAGILSPGWLPGDAPGDRH